MIRNYIKLAFRSLIRNKTSSFVNITGLSVGMAVTILIGLWIFDELSHNKNHQNYDRIAQVWLNSTWNGNVRSQTALPFPLGNELRTNFRDDFRYISMTSWTSNYILAYGDKKFIKTGNAVEPDFTEMLTLKMLKGSRNGLKDPSSIMLSGSVAKALFGNTDPINKVLKVD
ncbi:MAG TPA: ABC transporter permease, partial [Flavitalea sp.]|nr:ABC transporter permease [Flavitalea sp.]